MQLTTLTPEILAAIKREFHLNAGMAYQGDKPCKRLVYVKVGTTNYQVVRNILTYILTHNEMPNHNVVPIYQTSTTKHPGITWDDTRKQYKVILPITRKYVGRYRTLTEAVKHQNEALSLNMAQA